MGALGQSQLEKPKYKQEKNVTGVWEPEVGFGVSELSRVGRGSERKQVRSQTNTFLCCFQKDLGASWAGG